MYTLKGIVKAVEEPRELNTMVEGRKLFCRNIIVTDEETEKDICFIVFGFKGRLIKPEQGKRVECYFRIDSRQREGRWYTDCVLKTLTAFK